MLRPGSMWPEDLAPPALSASASIEGCRAQQAPPDFKNISSRGGWYVKRFNRGAEVEMETADMDKRMQHVRLDYAMPEAARQEVLQQCGHFAPRGCTSRAVPALPHDRCGRHWEDDRRAARVAGAKHHGEFGLWHGCIARGPGCHQLAAARTEAPAHGWQLQPRAHRFEGLVWHRCIDAGSVTAPEAAALRGVL